VVIGKGKAVPRAQPAMVGMAAIFSFAQGDHALGNPLKRQS
jgi:hypothetical protein